MKHNVGKTDRIIRIILGIIGFALGFYFHTWWGLFGLIPFITGIIGWCPIYAILGISTAKK
ncbi:MAG TPA: DUF2892 domain-containing protein [Candidatus Cloacimonadota bacterium]|nr:DUF2892 domain-containing protein [Candidatus Cloacimonadota bacterium]HPT70750.1 DUF2892 domain-containing protein [Candidatus Cloacimonadota bacterium]